MFENCMILMHESIVANTFSILNCKLRRNIDLEDILDHIYQIAKSNIFNRSKKQVKTSQAGEKLTIHEGTHEFPELAET
jgi:hypothetical protein